MFPVQFIGRVTGVADTKNGQRVTLVIAGTNQFVTLWDNESLVGEHLKGQTLQASCENLKADTFTPEGKDTRASLSASLVEMQAVKMAFEAVDTPSAPVVSTGSSTEEDPFK